MRAQLSNELKYFDNINADFVTYERLEHNNVHSIMTSIKLQKLLPLKFAYNPFFSGWIKATAIGVIGLQLLMLGTFSFISMSAIIDALKINSFCSNVKNYNVVD